MLGFRPDFQQRRGWGRLEDWLGAGRGHRRRTLLALPRCAARWLFLVAGCCRGNSLQPLPALLRPVKASFPLWDPWDLRLGFSRDSTRSSRRLSNASSVPGSFWKLYHLEGV